MSNKTGGIVLACLAVVGGLVVYWNWVESHAPNPQVDAHMRRMAGPPRAWREVHRQTLIADAFELKGWASWSFNPPAARPNVRASLQGRFNALPVEEVTFAVMDLPNFERFQAGYPPLVIYSAQVGQPIYLAEPAVPAYAIVFLQAPKAPQEMQFPTSVGELALQVLRATVPQPPARVTAEIERVVESFGSAEEGIGAGR